MIAGEIELLVGYRIRMVGYPMRGELQTSSAVQERVNISAESNGDFGAGICGNGFAGIRIRIGTGLGRDRLGSRPMECREAHGAQSQQEHDYADCLWPNGATLQIRFATQRPSLHVRDSGRIQSGLAPIHQTRCHFNCQESSEFFETVLPVNVDSSAGGIRGGELQKMREKGCRWGSPTGI